MKKILVPIDGSTISKKAIREAGKMARAFNASISLLTVIHIPISFDAGPPNQYYKVGSETQECLSNFEIIGKDNLKEGKDLLKGLDQEIDTVLLYGDPADQIVSYLDDHPFDLVVIGSVGLGASRFQQILIGSVASKILKYAKQPVMVVK